MRTHGPASCIQHFCHAFTSFPGLSQVQPCPVKHVRHPCREAAPRASAHLCLQRARPGLALRRCSGRRSLALRGCLASGLQRCLRHRGRLRARAPALSRLPDRQCPGETAGRACCALLAVTCASQHVHFSSHTARTVCARWAGAASARTLFRTHWRHAQCGGGPVWRCMRAAPNGAGAAGRGRPGGAPGRTRRARRARRRRPCRRGARASAPPRPAAPAGRAPRPARTAPPRPPWRARARAARAQQSPQPRQHSMGAPLARRPASFARHTGCSTLLS
jgi:hypothetical protein